MSFELKHSETAGEGLERIVTEQLDDTLKLLKKQKGDLVETVHEVRKDVKKIRAILRLSRQGLNADTYRYENEFFRDVGHQLSDARDAEVLIEAVDKLRDQNKGDHAQSFQKIHAALMLQRDSLTALLRARNALEYLSESLQKAQKRIIKWSLTNVGFSELEDGVQESYKRGRAAFDLAYSRPTFSNFHDWRKRVKDLHYQVRLLRPIWPEVMETLHDETGTLGDQLGEDHDLGVLDSLLKLKPDTVGEAAAARNLRKIIDSRRERLRADARPLGEKIYQEKPKAFIKRLDAVLQAW